MIDRVYLFVGVLEVVQVDLVGLGKRHGLVQGLDGDSGWHRGNGGHARQREGEAGEDGGSLVQGQGHLDVGRAEGIGGDAKRRAQRGDAVPVGGHVGGGQAAKVVRQFGCLGVGEERAVGDIEGLCVRDDCDVLCVTENSTYHPEMLLGCRPLLGW